MQVNLSPEPPGALGADEEQPLIFTVTRVAEHEWTCLKCEPGSASTRELFEHVRDVLAEDDENVIRVAHGRDPMKVKHEMIERGVGEQPIIFHTINEVIDLESDGDGDGGDEDELRPRPLQGRDAVAQKSAEL